VFERIDRGESIEDLPEYFHKGIRARQECLRRHGIEILPEYVERAVRCLMFEVSGTLDRIVRYEGRYVIVDDKSENDPLRYPKAKSIQFAIYANAGELFDPATFTIEAMPDVRRDLAIMLHFDKVNHTCEAYGVPIDVGWWGARLAREVRQWRKMECLIAPLISIGSWVPKEITDADRHAAGNGLASTIASDDVAEEPPTVEEAAIADAIIKAIPGSDDLSRWGPPIEEQSAGDTASDDSELEELTVSGINPMVEAEELIKRYKAKPGKQKEVWKAICRSVGITDLEHHIVGRNGLALAYVNKRNELGMTETQAEAMRAGIGELTPAGQEAVVTEVTALVEIAEGNRAQLLTHDEVLDEIEQAQSKQDLADIWKRFTDEYGEAAWTGQLAKAGMDRLRVIENQRPVASDNPFAD
jgi:hypothetical protein